MEFSFAGIPSITILKASAGNGGVKREVGLPVVGWYCTSKRVRVRRQLLPEATPQPTSSVPVLVAGTPTIAATPSVIKVTSSSAVLVKPTPVSTTVVVVSKTPTTEPPVPSTTPSVIPKEDTTKKPTTTEKPTTTKKPTTTEKQATTKKLTTTGKRTTTKKLTTEKPTTKKPTTTEKPTTEPSTTPAFVTSVPPKITTPEAKVTTLEIATPEVVTAKPEGPDLVNPIGEIPLVSGEFFKLHIPNDMFSDKIDGDTSKLSLKLMKWEKNDMVVVNETWIKFDETKQELYIVPTEAQIGSQKFTLIATNSKGLYSKDVITIKVEDNKVEEQKYAIYSTFRVVIKADFDEFMKDIKNSIEMKFAVASATGIDAKHMRRVRFLRGSVIMEWVYDKFTPNLSCNNPEVQAYQEKVKDLEKDQAMKYPITSAQTMPSKSCLQQDKPPEKQKRWVIVLVLVIVILVLILVVSVVLFVLYKRRRRTQFEPNKDEDGALLHKKKPAIFKEELEDNKPDIISLQPLVLPNEKPPASPNGDATHGMNGHTSHNDSNEADEKQPLTGSETPSDVLRRPPYSTPPPPYTGPAEA